MKIIDMEQLRIKFTQEFDLYDIEILIYDITEDILVKRVSTF